MFFGNNKVFDSLKRTHHHVTAHAEFLTDLLSE